MILNQEQINAINTREGAYNVIAAPGSGKTLVLSERVKALLQSGISPNDLLALTFTVEAANEMARRIGVKVSKLDRGGFRTFHSLCLRICQDESRFLPFGLSSDPVPQGSVLSKILSEAMKISRTPRKEFQAVRAYISKKKRQRISPEQAREDLLIGEDGTYADIYSRYEKALRDGGMLDFDSMILWAVTLLENDQVRDHWQYKYVLVDESQDTDDLQLRLLQLITKRHGNIFAVGDYCQAMYAFRGAHPENLLDLGKWFPNVKTLVLPTNYRSTPQVVAFCKTIAPIDNELTRGMRTERGNGPEIKFRMFNSSSTEAETTISDALTDVGTSVILARTNAQLADYETLCSENNVKYFLLGRAGFWRQPEIQNLVNLAGFVLSAAEPKGYQQEMVAPVRTALRQVPAKMAIGNIIAHARLETLYSNEDYEENENFALINIRKAAQIAERFPTLKEFVNHARKAFHASKKRPNALTLSTIHQSKGLEFRNVFVVGVQEKMMPHYRGELDEEKRIFYVACSRAAEQLCISFVGTPSPFIKQHLTPEIQKILEKNVNYVQRIERQISLPGMETNSNIKEGHQGGTAYRGV